jgi:tetratricopeptide (TPR) repeat protein
LLIADRWLLPMNKESILFSLVGVGFGLFFGFAFVTWANHRAQQPEGAAAQASAADGVLSQAEADAAIKRARENPKDFEAQMEGARAYHDVERYDDAVDLLLRANELQPTNVEPVVALAHVNADAGNYRAAEKWYVAAVGMKPDHPAIPRLREEIDARAKSPQTVGARGANVNASREGAR